MDRFFKATTRFRELYRQTNDQEPDHCSAEVELVGSSQDMSYHGFSFSDLVQSAQMNIVWITPHAYVVNTIFDRQNCWGDYHEAVSIMLKASCDRKMSFEHWDTLHLVALSCKELTSACNTIFSLLAISNVVQLYVQESNKPLLLLPVSARTLSNFVKASHSLVHVQFDDVTLEGHHMSAFAAAPPGLTLYLEHCMLTAAAKDVLKNDARLLRMEIALDNCNSDTGILADVLDGKNKSIIRTYKLKSDEHRGLDACVYALKHNQNQGGLVHFSFGSHALLTDELVILLDSLKTHPTLVKLDLCGSTSFLVYGEGVDHILSMMAIVDMLQVNTVIQEIELGFLWEEEDWRIRDEMILPLLESNKLRARVRVLAHALKEVAADSADTTEVGTSP
jgi:hypothetical protein